MVGFLYFGSASAADIAQPLPVEAPAESGWTFAAAPYIWMAGLEGDIGQFGFPPISVDASFSDVLKNFDFGFMAAGEARYGRFAIVSDVLYTKLSAGAATPFGVLADSVDVKSEVFSALVAGSYRLIESESGNLDALAGGRLWWVNTDIDLVNSPLPVTSFNDGDTWVDPIVGLKGRMNLTPEAYLTGWAMIGGFGVASDLTWDVMAGAGYEVTDRVSIVGGYRALAVDYQKDSFVFDVVQHGPFLGANIAF
jgi:hypothetical protein